MLKEEIALRFQTLQDSICRGLEDADGKATFIEDLWQREGGGGGRSRVISQGNIFEKGGVNFSAVSGRTPAQLGSEHLGSQFFATGVSIVIHPENPHVPIIHMNVRYFETDGGIFWFGGGIDLTPIYIYPEDARHFHQTLQETCNKFNAEHYPRFKKWADDYFFLNHRHETRGIGGIFFDHLGKTGEDRQQSLEFTFAVGETFLQAYLPLVEKRKNLPYTEKQKQWQALRRGRYVEFNLIHDRGTKFGLETNGRTESILMSLPPIAAWEYRHEPEAGSPEALTLALLKKGIDWV
jgi:coproporphyrinogen III oxidase